MAATRSPRTAKAAKAPDAVLLAAIEQARGAIADLADPSAVGAHEGYEVEGERTLTHYFTCLSKGYRGWRWAVTMARVARAKVATISEIVLLPGAEAILAPTWLPWADRLAPGDLGDSDTLPYRGDDPRLMPGYTATDGSDDDEDADRVAVWELGLGRIRVLSPEGRDEATQRWVDGPNGPRPELPPSRSCQTCGFFLPLAGSLRLAFGVCANEWSPSDGQVVDSRHGCGAHSETDVEQPEVERLPDLILDEISSDSVAFVPRDLSKAREDDAPATEAETEQVVEEAEPLVTDEPAVAEAESAVAETEPAVAEAEPLVAEPSDT